MKNKKFLHVCTLLITIIFYSKYNPIIGFVFILIYGLAIYYPTILYYIAMIKYSPDNFQESNKYFDRMNRCFYSETKFRITYAYYLILQNDVDKAEELIKSIQKKKISEKDKIQLCLNYSLLMWRKNDLDQAIDILKKANADAKHSTIYQNLGYFLILKGDYNAALEYNLEALDFNSSSSGIIDNLGQTYYYLQEYDKAIELFEEVISKKPTFATPYYYYGLTLIKKGNSEKALQVLKKGLDCNFNALSITTKEDLEAKILELGEN